MVWLQTLKSISNEDQGHFKKGLFAVLFGSNVQKDRSVYKAGNSLQIVFFDNSPVKIPIDGDFSKNVGHFTGKVSTWLDCISEMIGDSILDWTEKD